MPNRIVLLSLCLAACALDDAGGPDSRSAAPDAGEASRKHEPKVEVCDGKDNDRDGTTDEDCRSCDMVVTRTAAWWTNHACVSDGGATGEPLVPVTVGTTTLKTGADVGRFIKSHAGKTDELGDQIVTAKLNRSAFGIGGAIVGDIDGDGDKETLDDAITYAEGLYSGPTTSTKDSKKDDKKDDKEERGGKSTKAQRATSVLRHFSRTGRKLATWFDESCKAAPETCNGLDDDNDGRVDEACLCEGTDPDPVEEPCFDEDSNDEGDDEEGEGASYAALWFPDHDSDGFGDDAGATRMCTPLNGWVEGGGDCDDRDRAVNPAAAESCNAVDDNCNNAVDEGVGSTFYADADGDSFGGAAAVTACAAPVGYVATSDDCDDTASTVHPGATETCDGADQDCDGAVDEAVGSTFYADTDGDGHGGSDTVIACSVPVGYVATSDDCDDGAGTTFPGAAESCNSVDDDCDGAVDDGVGSTFYADSDGDGHGGTTPVTACSAPDGYVATSDDCDDSAGTVYPGAAETCDGADQDCDGAVDDGVGSTFYADSDGDGHGGTETVIACTVPVGYVATSDDCDDGSASAYPGATETCDGADEDCDGEIDNGAGSSWYADTDGDGFGGETKVSACAAPNGFVANGDDCDDTSAAASPKGTETCDGTDEDCDGSVDDNVGDTWYADADGDGFGDAAVSVRACSAPSGFVATPDDCDDTVASVHPGAAETCDGVDEDCDTAIDENVGPTWFADADGDGFGDAASSTVACSAPANGVADATDCDDNNAEAHPGASELCDGVDQDCNGVADDDSAVDATTWFLDADADGHGDAAVTARSCAAPESYVTSDDDCDDTLAAAYPGAPEVCDGADDDCDGTADEDDAVDATTWYLDADADGYGDDSVPHRSCEAPTGYAALAGDCDDHESASNPGLVESCDELDNDCDGTVDEPDAEGAEDLFADADLDGHGDPAVTIHGCVGTPGAVQDDSDCDDTRSTTWPGAPEYCNGRDDDCNGEVDTNAIDMRMYYLDADGDAYGDAEVDMESCTLPQGYSSKSTDCDDTDELVNPSGVESCDGVDQDCNGDVDDAAVDAIDWHLDADADGHGTEELVVTSCEAPEGTAALDDDCDDTSSARFPGNTEICDELDNDCDDRVDVDVVGMPTWYADHDADGYGRETASLQTCTPPEGYVADATDCNDSKAGVHPGAEDLCNMIDDDCDEDVDEDAAWSDWYADEDGDTFGDEDSALSACEAPAGYVVDATDCNDHQEATYPGATETCDGHDNDCDGTVDDDDVVAWTAWYADGDDDGYGDSGAETSACSRPRGYVANAEDCDDLDEAIHPTAPEACDEQDNNCDGRVDELDGDAITLWYTDADGDGHGDEDAPVASCIPLDGIVESADDCDDTDDRVSPEAIELCNTVDDDCDGETDEDDAIDVVAWYGDVDADGAGTDTDVIWNCNGAEGYVAQDGDCDDDDAARSPFADELCNGVDDDCDNETDEGSALDAITWYADADGDGMGSDTHTTPACSQPDGWLEGPGDCDDGDASIHPGAAEVCNDTDDDCDGAVDDDTTVGARTFYADADGDGYGALTGSLACSTPDGYLEVSGDCNDGSRAVHPDATEVCNGVDDNCDGSTDGTDASHQPSWYGDADQDGFGDEATTVSACSAPVGYIADDRDCDDGARDVNPDALELCSNGIDDDCDGVQEWCGPYGDRGLADADAVFPGAAAGDGTGRAVTLAPDLDGDGRDDVVLGGIGIDHGVSNGGGAYVHSGDLRTSVAANHAEATIYGGVAGGFAGRSLAGTGDVDGDGLGDLLIGANNDSTQGFEAGAAFFLRGPVSGPTPLAGAEARLLAEGDGDWAGYSVDGAGDVDGDGLNDLLVGAPYQDAGGSRAGAVYVWYGAPSGDVDLGNAAKLVGEEALDRAGTGMAGVGDMDGDGFDDVVVGAWSDNTAYSKAGAAYVLYGPITGTRDLSTADAKLRGEARNHRAGVSVAGPGDMDGDGLADVIIGADQAPAAYLVTAVPTGTHSLTDAAAKLKGEDVLGHAGWAVDGAGDVDGDGERDLIIGAYAQSDGAKAPGMAYLVCGPVTGTVLLKDADGRLAGQNDGDEAGYAVSGGGDVDGDGLDDLLIGAWNANGSGVASGVSYLFYGAGR